MKDLKKLQAKYKKALKAHKKAEKSFDFSKSSTFQDYEDYLRPTAIPVDELGMEIRLIEPYKLSKLSEYGDHMTLKEFEEDVDCGGFIDYDGFGRYAMETQESDIYVYPSDIRAGKGRKDFTHIMWFNK